MEYFLKFHYTFMDYILQEDQRFTIIVSWGLIFSNYIIFIFYLISSCYFYNFQCLFILIIDILHYITHVVQSFNFKMDMLFGILINEDCCYQGLR